MAAVFLLNSCFLNVPLTATGEPIIREFFEVFGLREEAKKEPKWFSRELSDLLPRASFDHLIWFVFFSPETLPETRLEEM